MTPQEHKLIILMFARLHESMDIVATNLKSHGVWNDADQEAFRYASHADEKKLEEFVTQATYDYLEAAKNLGVATGLE
jgi:hypothetical protein